MLELSDRLQVHDIPELIGESMNQIDSPKPLYSLGGLSKLWVFFKPTAMLQEALKQTIDYIRWHGQNSACNFDSKPSSSASAFLQLLDYATCAVSRRIPPNEPSEELIKGWPRWFFGQAASNYVAAIALGYLITFSVLLIHSYVRPRRHSSVIVALVKVWSHYWLFQSCWMPFRSLFSFYLMRASSQSLLEFCSTFSLYRYSLEPPFNQELITSRMPQKATFSYVGSLEAFSYFKLLKHWRKFAAFYAQVLCCISDAYGILLAYQSGTT